MLRQSKSQREGKSNRTLITESMEKDKKRKLNRQARVTVGIFVAIFVFMIGFYLKFIIFDSYDVLDNTYNKRISAQADSVVRGTIYSADKEELAYTDTKDTKTTEDDERVYPYDELFCHIVGINAHGNYGIEKLCNTNLSSSQSTTIQEIINDFSGNAERGADVYTTLDTGLQEAAYDALGDNDGAVFVIEPSTGKILACVSKPDYDPNTVEDIWDDIESNSTDSILLNRALQGQYIPGSTFKIVTTLAYMRQNEDSYSDFTYSCGGSVSFEGFSIDCFDGNSHGTIDLETAFLKSCNSAFATIGVSLDVAEYRQTAKDLLFNSELPFELDYTKSSFALKVKNSTTFNVAQTSIGQGETTVSPAHMALIAAAICNDGVLMEPMIVKKITDYEGNTLKTYHRTEYTELMTKEEADQLEEYMSAVCTSSGTGRVMANTDYDAYGKTGTAQLDSGDNVNSWFVGYARDGEKEIAIAVVLENITDGSDSAVTRTKEIFDYYFD